VYEVNKLMGENGSSQRREGGKKGKYK